MALCKANKLRAIISVTVAQAVKPQGKRSGHNRYPYSAVTGTNRNTMLPLQGLSSSKPAEAGRHRGNQALCGAAANLPRRTPQCPSALRRHPCEQLYQRLQGGIEPLTFGPPANSDYRVTVAQAVKPQGKRSGHNRYPYSAVTGTNRNNK
ncbi:hypothetical protein NOF04DRAFT_1270155 [Fusarium oxysporum II5]|nr:hypothetical protein NOF04DRAFT_1270155 [Fusarium oxysporum II5]